MCQYFRALLSFSLFTVVLLGSASSYAKVKTIEGFSGFSWGLTSDQIKQRMKEFSYVEEDEKRLVFPRRYPTKEEIDAIFDGKELPPQKINRLNESIIGFAVKHKVFEFDKECGFFSNCRLVKGLYEITDVDRLHDPEKVRSLISALNDKYGEYVSVEGPTKRLKYYWLYVDYEFRDLYWFAEDGTYVKLSFGIVVNAEEPVFKPEAKLKNGQIAMVTLLYSGVSDIEVVESTPPKELGI